MTAADMKAAIALGIEQAMKLLNVAEPPAVTTPEVPAPVKKRGLSEEQKRKMAEGRERARAAKSGKPAAPAKPAVATVTTPPAKAKKPAEAWSVKPHTTKKGVKGLIVNVGPLSAWLPEGDKDRKAAFFAALNLIRTDAAHEIAKKIG